MDTLKSYFSKIISSGSPAKLSRKGSLGKLTRERERKINNPPSRSYSVNNQVNNDPVFHGPAGVKGPSNLLSVSYNEKCVRDGTKTPPPVKPPRRDQLFIIEFKMQESRSQHLGVNFSTNNNNPPHCRTPSDSSAVIDSVEEDPAAHLRKKSAPVRIVSIDFNSLAHADGRLRVNDEVLEINGRSVIGESIDNSRLLLDSAIKLGIVRLKIRRKRRGTSAASPHSLRQTSTLNNKFPRTIADDNAYMQGISRSATCLPGDCDNNIIYANLNGSLNSSSNPLTCSTSDIGSNDDVFSDNMSYNGPEPSYGHGPHQRNVYGKPPMYNQIFRRDSEFLNTGEDNCDGIPKQRTHSASTVEETLHSTSRTTQLYLKSNGNRSNTNGMDSTLYQTYSPHMYRKNTLISRSRCSDDDFRVLRQGSVERQITRKTNNTYDRLNNSDNLSMNGSITESEFGPVLSNGKKRVVTKIHLLKDANGLGIHIAGGKGSKRGDIGIFVAGVTEGGAAYRDGRLRRGDELLLVNGQSLIGLTHSEAVDVLRKSSKLVQIVVALKVCVSSAVLSKSNCV